MGAKGGEGNYDAFGGEIEEMPFHLFLHAVVNILVSPEEGNLVFAFFVSFKQNWLVRPLESNLLIEISKQKWNRILLLTVPLFWRFREKTVESEKEKAKRR